MVGENRPGDEHETDAYEDEPPRSIFSAVWFRVVIVVVVLGVVAAVAVPYVLDWVNPTPGKPPSPRLAAPKPPAAPVSPPAPAPVPAPAPASPAPTPPAAVPVPTPAAPEKALAAKPTPPKAEPPAAAPTAKPATPAVKEPSAKAPSAAPARRVAKVAPKAAATKVQGGKGTYWVQVGAFRDPAAAARLTERLRAQKYPVGESTGGAASTPAPAAAGRPAPTGGDLYDILVSGGSAAEINAKLAAKGLAAEAAPGGAVIKPSLPLRDAVALSKDLAAEGLRVQVKRAGGAAPAPGTPTAAPAAAADGLRRVRVGPYPDRATASAALRELQAAGLKPYIVREGQ